MYDPLRKPSSQDIAWNEIQNGGHYVRHLAMHWQNNGKHKPPSLSLHDRKRRYMNRARLEPLGPLDHQAVT